MSTKQERIAAKLAHVDSQLELVRQSEEVLIKIGGGPLVTKEQEIAYQQRCRDQLAWANGKTNAEIEARIAELEAPFRPAILARKYGDMRGLSLDAVEAIRKIELLEIALGTHPGLTNPGKKVR